MQKSILSFFSSSQTKSQSQSTSQDNSPMKRKLENKINKSPVKVAKVDNNSQVYDESIIGKRLEIYWPKDKEWYPGTIKSKVGVNTYSIEYDDGDFENVDLAHERYRFVTYPKLTQLEDSDTEPEDNSDITSKSNSSSISKTPKEEDMETLSDDENETLFIPSKPSSQKIEEADSEEEEIKIPSPVKFSPNNSKCNNNNSPGIISAPSSAKKRLIKGSIIKQNGNNNKEKNNNNNNNNNIKDRLKKYKIEDDDDDDSYNGEENDEESDTDNDEKILKELVVDDDNDEDDDEEEIISFSPAKKSKYNTPKRNNSKKKNNKTSSTPSPSSNSLSNRKSPISPSSNFSSPITERGSNKATFDNGNHEHNTYKWLKEEIRDKNGNKPNDPNYDCHSLKVPMDYLNKQTPGLQQWWRFKMDYFDTILFFKLGKFYELYHFDADIAVKDYMKGEFAHAGFPEPAYPKYSKMLIDLGYRVARIEQTETPLMLKERNSNASGKKDKCVKREICNIVSKGTQIYTVHDDSYKRSFQPLYLLSIYEDSSNNNAIGLCWSDTASGLIKMTQFKDNEQKAILRTLIIEIHPSEILYDKNKISVNTMSILKYEVPDAVYTVINLCNFYNSKKVIEMINSEKYFISENNKENNWPKGLNDLLNDYKNEYNIYYLFIIIYSFKDEYQTSIRSFGGLLYYLHYCVIDYQVMSMKNISYYTPPPLTHSSSNNNNNISREISASINNNNNNENNQTVIMDGITIQNLELFNNNMNNSSSGTLYHYLDHCKTLFGKRNLKNLICNPPCNVNIINQRLDAVEDLMNYPHERESLQNILKSLPDLERSLAQLNGIGCLKYHPSHPDLRAILQDEVKYNKQKISTFLKTITAFRNVQKIPEIFSSIFPELKSELLKKLIRCPNDKKITSTENELFPNYDHILLFFDRAFDHKQAELTGLIKPNKGVEELYDKSIELICKYQDELEDYLQKQRRILNNSRVSYFGSGKDRYQLEVPEASCNKLPDDYVLTSQKKGFRRYKTKFINEKFDGILANEEKRDIALNNTIRTLFAKFCENSEIWNSLLSILSQLDILCSFSIVSAEGDNRGDMCRPIFIENSDNNNRPLFHVTDSRHPCVIETYSKSDFISNDISLGVEQSNYSKCMLLTGPNMGGKSTILRQTCVLVILAHLGCYLPASSCQLTPVDRIFTRIGASDKILAGQSTFYVEMSETSTILSHATEKSLVIIDELGRGTSTYDGTAIAYSTLKYVSEKIGCLTLFSTHYHSLVEDFSNDPNISLQHMDCITNEDSEEESLIFLYKLKSGSCPRSYGMNVARIAKLPSSVIEEAQKKSEEFESKMLNGEELSYVDLIKKYRYDITELKDLQNEIKEQIET